MRRARRGSPNGRPSACSSRMRCSAASVTGLVFWLATVPRRAKARQGNGSRPGPVRGVRQTLQKPEAFNASLIALPCASVVVTSL